MTRLLAKLRRLAKSGRPVWALSVLLGGVLAVGLWQASSGLSVIHPLPEPISAPGALGMMSGDSEGEIERQFVWAVPLADLADSVTQGGGNSFRVYVPIEADTLGLRPTRTIQGVPVTRNRLVLQSALAREKIVVNADGWGAKWHDSGVTITTPEFKRVTLFLRNGGSVRVQMDCFGSSGQSEAPRADAAPPLDGEEDD